MLRQAPDVLHLLLGQRDALSQQGDVQIDLCRVLQLFHAVKGAPQVAPPGEGTVVGQQYPVVVMDKEQDTFRHLRGGGQGVGGHRDGAQTADHLGEVGDLQGTAAGGKGGGSSRVGVDHRAHVGTGGIDCPVHGGLGGGMAVALQDPALSIAHHQHLRGDAALAHPRGGDEEPAVLQAQGEVPVVACHIAPLVEEVTGLTQLGFGKGQGAGCALARYVTAHRKILLGARRPAYWSSSSCWW